MAASPLPSLDPHVWLQLGSSITHCTRDVEFRAHFGLPPEAVAVLWTFIVETGPLPRLWGALELLQCLYFLKSPNANWFCNASRFGVDRRTLQKNIATSLLLIDAALPPVCNF